MVRPPIRRAAIAAALIAWLGLFVGQSHARATEALVEGLPLMPGLAEVADKRTVFSTAAGRIAEIVARGRLAPAEVETFYGETLPQLGWQKAAPGVYRRADEVLKIEIAEETGGIVVHFAIAPQ